MSRSAGLRQSRASVRRPPWGVILLQRWLPPWTYLSGRTHVFLCTFLIYTCYHLSRKPISVVKSVLHNNCTVVASRTGRSVVPENDTFCDWKPFDGDNYSSLFSILDVVYLSSYAVFMFFSGHAADRFNLRNYISIGAVLTGLSTAAFGFGYFLEIHSFAFYVIIQLVSGLFQATGWPVVVACMGHWFGKSQRGLFMGLWNSHTSLGNILGSVLAGVFVNDAWGWSFVVPGLIVTGTGVFSYFFLVPYPEEVGLLPPDYKEPMIDVSAPQSPTQVGPRNDDASESTCDVSTESFPRPIIQCVQPPEHGTISFLSALRVPGVLEYSFSLLFSKLVSYTFLFWLPDYISEAGGFDPTAAADLSAIFDVGGILGGILAGVVSDRTESSATVCVVMLILGIPMLYIYFLYGVLSIAHCIGLLIPLGLLVNGPYALITTAVSADLGQHPSLRSNAQALATVTGIIDGTGSIGAALGPFLCGLLKPLGWLAVFAMLIFALAVSAVLLIRRVAEELSMQCRARRYSCLQNPTS